MGIDAVSLDYPTGPPKAYENKVMSHVRARSIFCFLCFLQANRCVTILRIDSYVCKDWVLCRSLAGSWADFSNISFVILAKSQPDSPETNVYQATP